MGYNPNIAVYWGEYSDVKFKAKPDEFTGKWIFTQDYRLAVLCSILGGVALWFSRGLIKLVTQCISHIKMV